MLSPGCPGDPPGSDGGWDHRGKLNGESPSGPPWKPPAIGFQAVLEEGHLAAMADSLTQAAESDHHQQFV